MECQIKAVKIEINRKVYLWKKLFLGARFKINKVKSYENKGIMAR